MNIFTQSIEDEQATLDYIYQQEHPYDPDDPWPYISELDEPELEYYNKMKLIENADGSWIDPSTIVAIHLAGGGAPVVVLDRCPPLRALTITCKNMEAAKAEVLRLAYAALGVQLDPE